MSTTTHTLDGDFADHLHTTGGGFWQRAFQRVMEAQERKARAVVHGYLSRQSDENLAALGYGPVEIKSIRSQADNAAIW